MPAKADKLLTAKELAPKLNIHWQTVLKWRRQGIIPAVVGGGNFIRFSFSAVDAAMKKNGEPK